MYLIIMSTRRIMILLQSRFQHSQLFDCAAVERANPKMFSKYICVTQSYLCLESILEHTLNTSAAEASVSAVPGASEVNDVVNHITGKPVFISRLSANLVCNTRATGVEAGTSAHWQRLAAVKSGKEMAAWCICPPLPHAMASDRQPEVQKYPVPG